MKGTQEANMQDTIFHNRAPKYPNNTRQVKILAKGVKFQQFSIKLRMALKKKGGYEDKRVVWEEKEQLLQE